jgi:hypothetical protein
MSNNTYVGSGRMAISSDAVDDSGFDERGMKKRPVPSYLPLAQQMRKQRSARSLDIESRSNGEDKLHKGSSSTTTPIVSIAILSILSFIIGSASMHSLKLTAVSTEMSDYAEIGKSLSHPLLAMPPELDGSFLNNDQPHILEAGSPSDQQLVFWDVAMSGRDVMETICSDCFNRKAVKVKPHDKEMARGIFYHLQNHISEIDIIVSHYLYEVADMLENLHKKAKVFTLLRHPVDRTHAVYFQLQQMGKLQPENTTFEQYVRSPKYGPHNFMVRFLTNKIHGDITEEDLAMAMAVLERKFIVGLWEDLPAAIERFDKVLHLGAHADAQERSACQMILAHEGTKRTYDRLEEGSELYELLAAKNQWDMHLYEFGKKLYFQQSQLAKNMN